MHWLDIVIIVAVLLIAALGWRIGFLRNAVVLIAVVVGVVLAGSFHERVIVDLAISDDPTPQMRFASFVAIVLVVVLLGAVAGAFLRGAARRADARLGRPRRRPHLRRARRPADPPGPDRRRRRRPPARRARTNRTVRNRRAHDGQHPVVRALLPNTFDIAIREFLDGIGETGESIGL